MALNKQKILSELGSVVNQLQSAECGCMGKLFSDPSQASDTPMQSYGGCQMGRCCHGHGGTHTGEPHPPMNNQCMNRPCMGMNQYPKFIADTYSYLNQNLMQPTVNEVYSDLKSISPANAIMNNPMASKMGLSAPAQGMAGQGDTTGMTGNSNQEGGMTEMSPGNNVAMGMGNANISQPMGQQSQYIGQMGKMNQAMNNMNQPQDRMSGMGSQIVKMMMGDKPAKAAHMPVQNGQLTDSMQSNSPQSPDGQVGATPMNTAGTYDTNATMQNTHYGYDNAGTYAQNPTTQYMSQPNSYAGNAMMSNMPQNNMNSNSAGLSQNVTNTQPTAANGSYGQHNQGVKKFGEMFPGMMQGDLGFDPMAIALQMNPANQQQAAMNSMKQLMNGNSVIDPKSNVMQAASGGFAQMNNAPTQGAPTQANQQVMPSQPVEYQQPMHQQSPVQYQQSSQQQMQQPQTMQHQQIMQQQPMQTQPTLQQQPMQYQQSVQQQQPMQYQQSVQQQQPNTEAPAYQVPQQQVYTAAAGSHYQQPAHRESAQYQQQPQQITDPNTGAVANTPILSGGYEQMVDPNVKQGTPNPETPAGHLIMDPIFPADTSKNRSVTFSHHIRHPKNYNYNTLGQPVQLLDPRPYRSPEPTLPQTLSPPPVLMKSVVPQAYSNVKNTMSKTSIMANGNVGRTTSKNQLQHLYNQYKGSQSFTQQNVNAPIYHPTHSEGKINANVASTPRTVPVERVAGDTVANNIVNNEIAMKLEQPYAPTGDVGAVNKPQGDGPGSDMKGAPMNTSKGRNGLQDMVFTSGPTTTSWSFHGHNRLPYSTGYNFRSTIR